MQPTSFLSMVTLIAACLLPITSRAQGVLTGDTRLACEAILCLSSAIRPSECTPSLQRYFGISMRKFSDTIQARLNFLSLCPVSSQTPQMQSLVTAIANGAGRCDAASLNVSMLVWTGGENGYTYISNRLPDYCSAYAANQYTNLGGTTPKYVGTPERGGAWVSASDYNAALAAYNARIAAEEAASRAPTYNNGN